MPELKRTPLRDFHASHGGRMVDFAGWDMPVQYRSILEEHKAVRQAAGLFDVSHMGEVDVRGVDARKFLDHLVPNDVSRLFPGRVMYTTMCYPDGGVVDDLLIYCRGENDFFLCINAGNIDKDLAWISAQAKPYSVSILNRSDDYGLLAVQGPRAAALVQSLTKAALAELKYYHFTEGEVAGVPALISRTGYTGEDGVELYIAAAATERLADALLAAGAAGGLQLTGLGARDSLRLEAGYPLYGHELSEKISPLSAGLGWTVKLEKASDFVGRAALAAEKATPSPKKVVYFRTGDRRIIRAGSAVLDGAGEIVGEVLSGTLSPMLNEAIGSALVTRTAASAPLAADVRGTKINLQLVKPPFVPLKKVS